MKTRTITTIKGFYELKNSWSSLFKKIKQDNPFLSWEWNYYWCKNYGINTNIRIICIEDNEELVAVVPLQIKSKTIMFLSDPVFSDYMDLLILNRSDSILNSIYSAITKLNGWNKILLLTLKDSSPNTQFIIRILKKLNLYFNKENIHLNPVIDLSLDYNDNFNLVNNKVRKEIRRTTRILDKEDNNWKFHSTTINNSKSILKTLFSHHLNRQTNKVGTSIFDSDKNRTFFNNLKYNLNEDFKLHFAGIYFKEKYVTASMSIIFNNVFYYWITSFDPSFKQGSIGNYHINLLIKDAYDYKLKRFDFMGGTETYKLRWTKTCRNNYQLIAFKSFYFLKLYNFKVYLRSLLLKCKDNSKVLKKLWITISKIYEKNKL